MTDARLTKEKIRFTYKVWKEKESPILQVCFVDDVRLAVEGCLGELHQEAWCEASQSFVNLDIGNIHRIINKWFEGVK